MYKMKIIGIGAITTLGTDITNIWNVMNQLGEHEKYSKEIPFTAKISSGEKRRMNRYSRSAIYVAQKACEDCNLEVTPENEYRIGTIYTTGFGPLKSNLIFADSVRKGDPDLCSPTVFSSTVSNACVGQVCINLGCKGVSTLIMGSNNLGYSQMLLHNNDADYIITGAVEEYCEELNLALREKDCRVNEASVAFVVTNEQSDIDGYANFVDCLECNLGVYPLLEVGDTKKIKHRIKNLVSKLVHNYKIDTVFLSDGSKWIYDIEKEVIKEELPEDVKIVEGVKKEFGETLGAAYNLNVMIAALCLKNQMLPLCFDKKNSMVQHALVLGYDVSGNYNVSILER